MSAVAIVTQIVFGASLLAVGHVLGRTVIPALPRMIALLKGGAR